MNLETVVTIAIEKSSCGKEFSAGGKIAFTQADAWLALSSMREDAFHYVEYFLMGRCRAKLSLAVDCVDYANSQHKIKDSDTKKLFTLAMMAITEAESTDEKKVIHSKHKKIGVSRGAYRWTWGVIYSDITNYLNSLGDIASRHVYKKTKNNA